MALRDLWRRLSRRGRGDEESDMRHSRDMRSDLPSGLAKGMKPPAVTGQEKPKN